MFEMFIPFTNERQLIENLNEISISAYFDVASVQVEWLSNPFLTIKGLKFRISSTKTSKVSHWLAPLVRLKDMKK